MFLPQGVEIELVFALRAADSKIRAIFKIIIYGHETWNLKKVLEVVYGTSFYSGGQKLSLFLLYGQRFPVRAILTSK